MSDTLHQRVPTIVTFERDLIQLYQDILRYGEERIERTGVGTTALFGERLVVDLAEGFPLVTTKKMPFKSILSEILWFIEGTGDERRLAEILHGTRDPSKKTIWSANAEGTSGSKFQPSYPGDLGRVYGVQWRTWNRFVKIGDPGEPTYIKTQPVDQLADVVHMLKTDAGSRRIILTAWNPGELDQMALPPCHMFVQFYRSNPCLSSPGGRLSAQLYMRSVDCFLGLPFNIASYALLIHMIAHIIEADVGALTMVFGDTHLYNNHVDQVQEQWQRKPLALPELRINRKVTDIDDFKMEDFELIGYQSYDAIKAPMAA